MVIDNIYIFYSFTDFFGLVCVCLLVRLFFFNAVRRELKFPNLVVDLCITFFNSVHTYI